MDERTEACPECGSSNIVQHIGSSPSYRLREYRGVLLKLPTRRMWAAFHCMNCDHEGPQTACSTSAALDAWNRAAIDLPEKHAKMRGKG